MKSVTESVTSREQRHSSYQPPISSDEDSQRAQERERSSIDDAIPGAVLKALADDGLAVNKNSLVTFAHASPSHPRQWTTRRKLYDTFVICFLEFVTTIMSNAGSNIADESSRYLGISREVAIFCLSTLYLFGQAFGGLIFPPITEVFGTKIIYASSTALYAGLCLMTGVRTNLATIIIGRFFTGLLSSIPTCCACGSLENMYSSKARIWAISIWAAAGVYAMSIGPLYAVAISESGLGW